MENQTALSTNGKQVALITGANQGVCNEIAKALAAAPKNRTRVAGLL